MSSQLTTVDVGPYLTEALRVLITSIIPKMEDIDFIDLNLAGMSADESKSLQELGIMYDPYRFIIQRGDDWNLTGEVKISIYFARDNRDDYVMEGTGYAFINPSR